jgi:hypothetical protein
MIRLAVIAALALSLTGCIPTLLAVGTLAVVAASSPADGRFDSDTGAPPVAVQVQLAGEVVTLGVVDDVFHGNYTTGSPDGRSSGVSTLLVELADAPLTSLEVVLQDPLGNLATAPSGLYGSRVDPDEPYDTARLADEHLAGANTALIIDTAGSVSATMYDASETSVEATERVVRTADMALVALEDPIAYYTDAEACPECAPVYARTVRFALRAPRTDDDPDAPLPETVEGEEPANIDPRAPFILTGRFRVLTPPNDESEDADAGTGEEALEDEAADDAAGEDEGDGSDDADA